jgi:Protein of unknown function (DUF1580)
MSIDLKTETIIDVVRQAPQYLGSGRNGKPVHKSFLIRAIKKGVNGHRLEALRIGSRWISSIEALQRWAESQTPDLASGPAGKPAVNRRKAAEQAGRELDRLGF